MSDKIYAKGMTKREYMHEWYVKNKDKVKEKDREYAAKNRDKLNERSRVFRKENPDRVRASKIKARHKLMTLFPEKYIWQEIKKKAKQRNIPFNIDPHDITVPKLCPILGIEISFAEKSSNDHSPTVDRLIPELGYVKGNCFVISQRANRMKQDSSLDDLEKIVSYIKKRMNRAV